MLINKKTLEHLADLSRIEISDKRQATSDKEKKLLKDLQKILGHFKELKGVDTRNVEPMAGGLRLAEGSLRPAEGGTIEKNVFREDTQNSKLKAKSSKLIEAFPEKENGFLKVPPVFE